MAWAVPNVRGSALDKDGRIAASDDILNQSYFLSLSNVNNWRASHQYPLNTFQMTLRRRARSINDNAIVSQRIKRFESIQRKLIQTTTKLSQMQDIGGARAVLPSVDNVMALVDLYKSHSFDHSFKNEKDYILAPKDDGYRSYHMIYRYKGRDRFACYDGMQIEIQIRTQLQHAWATAVEAVGTFTRQALKWRGGDSDWRRFFVLMSSAIATIENEKLVESAVESRKDIGLELRDLSRKLQVHQTLQAYRMTLNYVGSLQQSKAKLLLVHMRPDEGKVEVEGFRLTESKVANEKYATLEKAISSSGSAQAVLVRVDSVKALQKAYPNYFLDTAVFADVLKSVSKW